MTKAGIAQRLQHRGLEGGLDQSARSTDRGGRDGSATDELCADTPTLDVDPLADATPHGGSFEHRRLVSVVRRQLFGRGGPPRIGRYAIERRLGSGGMGDVYLAHDEALDRKIAVKRVRAASTSERDQERLRREARALARLSHPNVVQVYEVDEHEGRTFLAMEYVDGQTLGEWLAEQPRPWRTVLDTFIAAGRGLAAAHEAGLVHRDFKPDNVLLGRDGSVRVADFGLVLAGTEPPPAPSGVLSLPASVDPRLSVTGTVLGTIRYMSLEQLRGAEVDARSDQFSFCVALYEALWRQPPFSLSSSLARLSDLQDGTAQPPRPPAGPRPPASLWRVIRRGLHKDPSERWSDMGSLLAALEDVTRRRRRLAWMGSAAAVMAMAMGGVVVTSDDDADPCATIERELQGTWDGERRAALEARAAGLGAGHVADSRERILAGLDRWSAGWIDARQQSCRARVEQRIEPERGRQQRTCLTRQRQRVGDLVELLLQPESTGDALAGAVDAVAELPRASACEDELALLGVEPPSPAIEDEVEARRRDLGRAHELRLLGRVDEGLTLAERSERATRALGYGPLHAEALAELARAEAEGGSLQRALPRLHDAIDAAELNHHDHLAAELWIESTLQTFIELGDEQAGAWQLRRAEVANGRIDASARNRARLAFARGQLAELRGDHLEAEHGYRAAVREAEGDDTAVLDVPSYWSNLARLVDERDPSGLQARPLHRAALDVATEHYGPLHPQTAQRAYLLAISLQAHDAAQATELFGRAAEIWTASHARPHRELGKARLLLAKLALKRGELDDAELHARELATLQAEFLPQGHRDHGDPAQLLATIHAVRGEHEEALQQARVALALWEPDFGLHSRVVHRLRSDAAAMLLALGRLDEAERELERLLPHVVDGPEHVSVRLRRSELALRRGRLDVADAELRAIEPLGDEGLGDHRFSHALLRALTDLRRGERLHPTALERLRSATASTPFTADQIAMWRDQLEMSAAERATLLVD